MPEEISGLERALREAPEDNEVLVNRLAQVDPEKVTRGIKDKWTLSKRIATRYAEQGLDGNLWDNAMKLTNAYSSSVLNHAYKGVQAMPIPESALNALGIHGSLMFSGGVRQRNAQEYVKRKKGVDPELPFPAERHLKHPYEENIGWIVSNGIAYLERKHEQSSRTGAEPNFPVKRIKQQADELAQRFNFREMALNAEQKYLEGDGDRSVYVEGLAMALARSRQFGHQRLEEDMYGDLKAMDLTPQELRIVGEVCGEDYMKSLAPKKSYVPNVTDQLGLEI